MRREKKNCAQCFKVLSDKTRLTIIKTMRNGTAYNVNQITDAVRVTQPTVSHHLRLLWQIGLLTRERKGREVHYAFNDRYPCKGCGVFSAAMRL